MNLLSYPERQIFTVSSKPIGDGENGNAIQLFFKEDFGLPTMQFRFEADGEKMSLFCVESLGETENGFQYSAKILTNNPNDTFDALKFAPIGRSVGWSYDIYV